MQVFIPFRDPLSVAKVLDERRLRKQVLECNQILKAISGESKYWRNHPVVKMYSKSTYWLSLYRDCLMYYLKGDLEMAMFCNHTSKSYCPNFLYNQELLDQHKRRLFTKDPNHYKEFECLGLSEENWYIVEENILIYSNGKLITKTKLSC